MPELFLIPVVMSRMRLFFKSFIQKFRPVSGEVVFIFLYVHVIPLILLYCLSHFDLSWSDQPVQVRPSRKRSWVNLVLFHEFNSAWRDVTVYVFISRYRWLLYSLYQFYSYGSEFLVLSSKYSMKIQLHWRCLIKYTFISKNTMKLDSRTNSKYKSLCRCSTNNPALQYLCAF